MDPRAGLVIRRASEAFGTGVFLFFWFIYRLFGGKGVNG